jgi:hypothetical protein
MLLHIIGWTLIGTSALFSVTLLVRATIRTRRRIRALREFRDAVDDFSRRLREYQLRRPSTGEDI